VSRLARVAAAGLVLLAVASGAAPARGGEVRVVQGEDGWRLTVDGRDFLVKGMNWDYIPIGQNYAYSLWSQPDDVIEAALANEMSLLHAMGVNAIRQYMGIPPRWVQYIHDRWGIYSVLNHPMARYGFTLDGVWIPNVDYSDPRLREAVKKEIVQLVEEYRDTPGVLMWLIGNENNYGLSWSSFEIEALPGGWRDAARARYLYSLYEEVTRAIQAVDRSHPVALANGDVQYVDILAEECRSLDVFGTNVYRGVSARDLFRVVREKLGIPVLFTEFGADAWNAREMREDQVMQCRYLVGQWEEIYEQTAGKGREQNCIGGLTFQWSDGWWKYRQEERLDIHDTNASWPNGGYAEDYVEGDNNMNEEWWGITAKGMPDRRGLYPLYPRAAYYALRQAYRLDPYAPDTDVAAIRAHFGKISPVACGLEARGDRAAMLGEVASRARLKGLRLEFETYSTGGKRTTTPVIAEPGGGQPAFRGFDQMQSFYADFEASPARNVTGTLSINVLGHVPQNPIDEIFYENRGRPVLVPADGDTLELDGLERVRVYRAGMTWDDRNFLLDGFYRTGHFHWGYEGDFFGLYREANYGENIDIYNGLAPLGFEMSGKRRLSGWKGAFGPELWWGANPAVLLKYGRPVGPFQVTSVYQEDLADQSSISSSIAVPVPQNRKLSLHVATKYGPVALEAGGLWSGNTKVGDPFDLVEKSGGTYRVLRDRVHDSDTFGGKAKATIQIGNWNWYAQGAYMGVVADGGPTATTTFTGWQLKDSGSGNQTNFLTGMAVNVGHFQVGPNFLWQKPLVGPIPADAPPPARPRNVLDDPFAVRANREMRAFEVMLTYDPTPATWMWMWDNDVREDAPLAASVGFVYRDYPTTMDAAIGILEDGRTSFAFPGATPSRDLWEVNGRLVSRLGPERRVVAHYYVGMAEPNGESGRVVRRSGTDGRLTWGGWAIETYAKFDDFGPYDYHRDFNLTYPLQVMGDVSYSLGAPQWFALPQTRVGIRGTYRSLDEWSPRYCPGQVDDPFGIPVCDPALPGDEGEEWEIRTYLHFAM